MWHRCKPDIYAEYWEKRMVDYFIVAMGVIAGLLVLYSFTCL